MNEETHASEEVGAAMPPRENLIRSVMPGVELRQAEDGTRTMTGHFAVFNEWTEINSMYEGRFLERIAPGAFRKTFQENGRNVKVLYDHGHDPSVGNKPLGTPRTMTEDERGAFYEVDLLDTGYVRDLIPALEKGLLGASFRFKVVREDLNKAPDESAHNPKGLPERTIQEIKLAEFGPVTFPAYEGATAGVRSMTDEYIMRSFLQHPDRLRALFTTLAAEEPAEEADQAAETDTGREEPTEPGATAPDENSAEPKAHPVTSRREPQPLYGLDEQEKPAWHL